MKTQVRPANARARRAHARARGTSKPFLAFDGEGADVNGRHELVTLSCSTSDPDFANSIVDPAGIGTRDALGFLLRMSKRAKTIPVAFFFNYDVNMILRDVPIENLRELWKEGETVWRLSDAEFTIAWIPTKIFEIDAWLASPAGDVHARCKIYDSFGFFQQSFVKAVHAWGLGGELEQIEVMKHRRGSFGTSEAELVELSEYSERECIVLCSLMEQVRKALHDVDLFPRSWLGAGAIASTLLAREKVNEHLDVNRPKRNGLDDAIMRSYFGGRTEVFQQGIHERAASADINSAYPFAATELPTELGDWRRVREYDAGEPWAIWRCVWRIPHDSILAPFPFRDRRSISFPLAGEGYYHAAEVAAARELYGDAIAITSGYVFTPASDVKPFAFLRDVYLDRQRLKAEGHAGEKVLKLGINSVYGKLAQGNARDGKRPKFQSYFWAGAITSITRARVLRACALAPDRVVAVATDGIVFSPEPPADLEAAPGLGGWELTAYENFFVAQPGMYHATQTETGEEVKHSRGFFTRELDFDALRELWIERGPVSTWPSSSVRFMGLGASLLRKDFSIWRQWIEGERRVSLYLSPRKRYDDEEPEPVKQLRPPDRNRPGISDPYVPKHAVVELDDEAIDWIEGIEQPIAG
jgi:hypothetical protein